MNAWVAATVKFRFTQLPNNKIKLKAFDSFISCLELFYLVGAVKAIQMRNNKMNHLFENGKPQSIPAVLANRDRRVALQNQLTAKHPDQTVIAAKLNIPGPIKNNQTIRDFFAAGLAVFEKQLAAKFQFRMAEQWLGESTGPERFYLVDGPAAQVKRLTTEFEEAQAAHRLFDLDVLSRQNNQTVSISRTELGLPKRQCLICGQPAKECARSRRHSVAELQDRVAALIESY